MNKPILACLTILTLAGCSSNNKPPTQKAITVENRAQNICINEFKALQSLSATDYDLYQKQFSQLTKYYNIYKSNKEIVNKDAQEILSIELNAKLKLICARVRGAAFHAMDKRSQEVNKL